MFLHEHGSEVSQIYAGIITSPLFRVDIPSSSKSIGFGTKASGTEADDEVELAEEFGPLDLVVGEQFSGRKILKIFMICYHINQGWRYSGKDSSSKGIVQGVHFNNKQGAWNPVGQDWCSGGGFLQRHESRAALIREVPSNTFMSEVGEWNGDFRVFWNKMLIEIGKAQKGLDVFVFDLLGFGPILNDLDLVRGHSEATQREDIA